MGRKSAANKLKIAGASPLKSYYTEVPRLVWAMCRNPFDLALWMVVKGIAGDDGECYLGRNDLAALAMMSAGQVSESRRYLIEAGLHKGEFRRDPGFPNRVWRLSIPDLWNENFEWSKAHAKIRVRVAFKTQQKSEVKAKRCLGPAHDDSDLSENSEFAEKDDQKVVGTYQNARSNRIENPAKIGVRVKWRGKVLPEPSPTDGEVSPIDEGMSPTDGKVSAPDGEVSHTDREGSPTDTKKI
jgi:hypothetical protein